MTAAVRSTIWRSTVLFIAHTATHQWIFVYHSQHGRRHWDIMILAPDINIQTYLLTNLQPRQREENRTVHCGGKSEAEVTNNRRLHSTYCTIDNYWHTRGIARPLCDSKLLVHRGLADGGGGRGNVKARGKLSGRGKCPEEHIRGEYVQEGANIRIPFTDGHHLSRPLMVDLRNAALSLRWMDPRWYE